LWTAKRGPQTARRLRERNDVFDWPPGELTNTTTMKYIKLLHLATELLKLALNEGWFDGILRPGHTPPPHKATKRRRRR